MSFKRGTTVYKIGLGARVFKYLLYQRLRHSIEGSCETETKMANTNKIYSTDLKIKQIDEIINKSTPKEHLWAKLKYIHTSDVTEFEKL